MNMQRPLGSVRNGISQLLVTIVRPIAKNTCVKLIGQHLPILVGAPAALVLMASFANAQIMSAEDTMTGYNAIKRAGLLFDDNELVDVAKLSNRRVLIVDYWAFWCPSCLAEFADLKKLQDKFGKNNIEVILVSEKKNWGRDVSVARKFGVTWRMARYKDDAGLANKARMLGEKVVRGKLEYDLPFSWVVVNDKPLITFKGNPGWFNGDGGRIIAGLFRPVQ